MEAAAEPYTEEGWAPWLAAAEAFQRAVTAEAEATGEGRSKLEQAAKKDHSGRYALRILVRGVGCRGSSRGVGMVLPRLRCGERGRRFGNCLTARRVDALHGGIEQAQIAAQLLGAVVSNWWDNWDAYQRGVRAERARNQFETDPIEGGVGGAGCLTCFYSCLFLSLLVVVLLPVIGLIVALYNGSEGR